MSSAQMAAIFSGGDELNCCEGEGMNDNETIDVISMS